MSHSVHTRNLSRSKSARKALVQSLTQALVKYERINTTVARAKETQRLAERLVTLGKGGTLANRRRAISLLRDGRLVGRLFSDIAPRFTDRKGGYTRVLHSGVRAGDGASMAILEWVELAPDLDKKAEPKRRERKAVPEASVPAGMEGPIEPGQQPGSKAETPQKSVKSDRPKGKSVKGAKPQSPKKGFMEGLSRIFKGRRKAQ